MSIKIILIAFIVFHVVIAMLIPDEWSMDNKETAIFYSTALFITASAILLYDFAWYINLLIFFLSGGVIGKIIYHILDGILWGDYELAAKEHEYWDKQISRRK